MGSDSEPQNSAPSNAANNFGVQKQTSFQPSASDHFTSNTTEPSAFTHPVPSTDDKGPESSEQDAPQFHGQGEIFSNDTSLPFSKWCRISSIPGLNDAARTTYVHRLQSIELCYQELMICQTTFSVFSCRSMLYHMQQRYQYEDPPSFHDIDRYTDLVFSILKFYHADQGSNKLSFVKGLRSDRDIHYQR